MDAARALFHDADKTQFVIVTIPTLMAAAESARLASSLRQEGIPLETLIVNQVGVLAYISACQPMFLAAAATRVAPFKQLQCSQWLQQYGGGYTVEKPLLAVYHVS
jgi:anion-transporting  ArsA/GET3 family ATPase